MQIPFLNITQQGKVKPLNTNSPNRTLEQLITQLPLTESVCRIISLTGGGGKTSLMYRWAACLKAGARVLNLTGSAEDAAMFDLAAEHDASVVLCHILGSNARDLDGRDVDDDPFPAMLDSFGARVDDARSRGVRGIAIDPGMGFGFRLGDQRARVRHQASVLLASFRLRRLGVPVCHSLPHSFELFEDQFRVAEGMFAVLAHLGGTGLYRTHEVPQVVAVLDALQDLTV